MCGGIYRADNQGLNKMVKKKSGNVDFTKGTTITVPSYKYKQVHYCGNLPRFRKKIPQPTKIKQNKPTIKPTKTYTRVCGNN